MSTHQSIHQCAANTQEDAALEDARAASMPGDRRDYPYGGGRQRSAELPHMQNEQAGWGLRSERWSRLQKLLLIGRAGWEILLGEGKLEAVDRMNSNRRAPHGSSSDLPVLSADQFMSATMKAAIDMSKGAIKTYRATQRIARDIIKVETLVCCYIEGATTPSDMQATKFAN